MARKLHTVLTIRLFTDEKCFGPGVATLLHNVEDLHSLRAASMKMNMAYSKAWSIIRNAEAQMGFKLLLSTTGGRHGGGAVLTEEGRKLLTAYDGYCREVKQTAEELYDKYFSSYSTSDEAPDRSSEA